MEKKESLAKSRFYLRRHAQRMKNEGLSQVTVYLHPDDLEKLKTFVEAMNQARGIPRSWSEYQTVRPVQ